MKRHIFQMLCVHEWYKTDDKPIYDYWDYSGLHVGVFFVQM